MDMDVVNDNLDMKQLFFNNLQLLDFDAPAMEATNHIPFNKTMFDLPNKRGAEIVLHFLFQRLNPTLCHENFRDCWPILDKKREQGFRKTCCNWLTNISQEEPESHLPRINASLFMSPGGEKFYQLLFHFSGYVLQKVLERELSVKMSERTKCPVLTPQNVHLSEVIIKNLACSSIRHRVNYFSVAQLNVKASKVWKDTSDEYVKEYRKLSKEIRELEYKVRDEDQKSVEASQARGSPGKRLSGHNDNLDPQFDPRTIKRAQRIQQVRDMWKQVEDFEQNEAAEREVVESIVERTINKFRLDAADIKVKVPDMLLRECGDEIRRRNVDNTYQGGKLNLVSVLQLWNLCLHLYLEKIKEVGVPNFEEEVKKLTSQVHVQQRYTQNAQTLGERMTEHIPVLKESIQKLRSKLDEALFQDKSPESIRTTSLGLGLVGPSPQPSFSPGRGTTPAGGIGVPKSPNSVTMTPEAANRITEDMKDAVKRDFNKLFNQPDLLKQRSEDTTSIPRPAKSQASSRQSSRPTSARSDISRKSSAKSTPKSSRSSKSQTKNIKDNEQSFTKITSPRTMMEKLQLGDSLRQEADGQEVQTGPTSSLPLSARSDRSNASSSYTLTDRSNKSSVSQKSVKSVSSASNRSTKSVSSASSGRGDHSKRENFNQLPNNTGRKTPSDLLVEEIMGEGKILSPFNSGLEAFESHNVVRRTPDMTEDMSRESLTPTNELYGNNDDDNMNADDIVEIKGPEIDIDNLGNISGGIGVVVDDVGEDNVDKDIHERGIDSESEPDGDSIEQRGVGRDGSGFAEDFIEGNDDIVEGMIEEGIRQVTQDGLIDLEEDTVQYLSHLTPNRSFENREHVEVDDECGPEFDDVSETSQRSTEQPIVIDKSLLMKSPQLVSERIPKELSSPESTDMFIDEEKFPSLENSPREAIIIDRSFQTPHQGKDKLSYTLPMNQQFTSVENQSPGVLSLSFQGKPSPVTKTPVTKDFLSRSLVMERSPLTEEIRKMFKRAVEDTPPPQETIQQSEYTSDLELPDMMAETDGNVNSQHRSSGYQGNTLKQSDISWDSTENLDDIEIPNLDQDMDDDIDDIFTTNNNVLQSEGVSIHDDVIDDFFTSKTPELPKRRALVHNEMIRTPQQQSHFDGSLGESSSMETPKFPQITRIENESPLISFTP